MMVIKYIVMSNHIIYSIVVSNNLKQWIKPNHNLQVQIHMTTNQFYLLYQPTPSRFVFIKKHKKVLLSQKLM